jgi:hypothetical protein
MSLLLDTCVMLWFLSNDPQLSAPAKAAIEDLATRIEEFWTEKSESACALQARKRRIGDEERHMIELTEEQQRQLDETKPLKARDPRTNNTYVLVPTDVYERMRAIIDGYTRRADWNDPALDGYERFRKKP